MDRKKTVVLFLVHNLRTKLRRFSSQAEVIQNLLSYTRNYC